MKEKGREGAEAREVGVPGEYGWMRDSRAAAFLSLSGTRLMRY